MSSPFVCRWGILATGGIARTFAKDLLRDPKERGTTDVHHILAAVASSSSKAKAESFISDVGAKDAKACANYKELVKLDDVDIIYVATPHSGHYQDTLLCLEAGKNVVCEKPFTVNTQQTEHLISVAKQRGLFLLEGVWTRFFPIVADVKRLLHEQKALGKIHRVESSFGAAFSKDDVEHRLLNPDLAGGALLDLGIYSLTWQMLILQEHPENANDLPKVVSQVIKTPSTGVDEFTTMILNFPRIHAQGIAQANMTVSHHKHFLLVQGEKGDLTISPGPHRPESYTFFPRGEDGKLGEGITTTVSIHGQGFVYEADACARALRDGNKEAAECPLATTVMTMKILDGVRRDADFKYPDAIEAVRGQ